MRIACPACDATYEVPDAMLGGGARKVRCAKCGNEWVPTAVSVAPLPPADLELEAPPTPVPAEAPPAEPPAAAPVPEVDPLGRHEPRLKPLRPRPDIRVAEPPVEEPDAPPPRAAAAIVAWALSLLVLAAAAGAAVTWRGKVMAAWPPSERVYAALGLH